MSNALLIEGGCHCRAIRYELHWPNPGEPARIPARRCGCSYCTRIDGVWTSHPEASLTILLESGLSPKPYRFATGTADFLVCMRCGITPLVTCEIEGRLYAVVNVNTFDDSDEPAFALDVSDTDFEGENLEARLSRRQARWISRVERVSR